MRAARVMSSHSVGETSRDGRSSASSVARPSNMEPDSRVGGIPYNRFVQEFAKIPVVQLNAPDGFVSMIEPKLYLQHGLNQVQCDKLATTGRWNTSVSLLAGDMLVLAPGQFLQHLHVMVGAETESVYVHAAVATDVRVYGSVTVPVQEIREHLGPGVAWSSTLADHFRYTATKLELALRRVGNLQMLPYGAQYWFAQEAQVTVSGGMLVSRDDRLSTDEVLLTDPLDDWTPVYETRYTVAPLVTAGEVYSVKNRFGVIRVNSPRVESDERLIIVNGILRFMEHEADVALRGPVSITVETPASGVLQRGISFHVVLPENDYSFDCHYGDD